MNIETILQSDVLAKFIFPLFLIVFIVYAILEKTKVLGSTRQVHAFVSLVIGLIFVSVAYPKMVVGNLILFLTVALVIMFVILILWGFAMGKSESLDLWTSAKPGLKWAIGIFIILAVTIATLWAAGVDSAVFNLLFRQSWSNDLWTNVLFIGAVVIAIVVVLRGGKAATGG